MKHILDRLLIRAEKASPYEKKICEDIYDELLDKYYGKDITYKEIFFIIETQLDYNSISDKEVFWKLRTLNELYAKKCGIIE